MGSKETSPDEIVIDDLTQEDIEAVLSIERESFSLPWSEEMFFREIRLSFSRNLRARIWDKGREELAGYVSFWIVVDEVHLHNIAVKKLWRRKGIASMLVAAMIRKAREEGAFHATLEVRRSNEGARRLYEKFGFTVMGIRPRYYEDTEDALIMWADWEQK